MSPRRFMVAQLGARMHYAVPRILAETDMLDHFYTDICAVQGWPRWLRLVPDRVQPAAIKRILARVPAGVPVARITAFNTFGFQYARRRQAARNASDTTRIFLWANRRFGELVSASDWGRADSVFTFNGAGLEILGRARREGLQAVMEQTIAPSAVEQQLLREEQRSHPGWEPPLKDGLAGEFSEREQEEWPFADWILCGSEFVRDGIAHCGGPMEKCVVVPYGVDVVSPQSTVHSPRSTAHSPQSLNRPLRVLTVGTVGLRKGAPYVMEAAKQLKAQAEFRWVGPISLLPEAAARMGQHVQLTGPVPRSEVGRHLEWADAFLLPSLCEGSATATYEALGHGLPVICTANTGSVVRDGREGFIVPVRDARAIARRIGRLAQDVELRAQVAASAKARPQSLVWRHTASDCLPL